MDMKTDLHRIAGSKVQIVGGLARYSERPLPFEMLSLPEHNASERN